MNNILKQTLILLILICTFAAGNNAYSQRKRKAKEVIPTTVKYRRDTIRVVDTVIVYVERQRTADTLFSIKNTDQARIISIDSLVNSVYEDKLVSNIHSYNTISLAEDNLTFDSKMKDISDKDLKERFEKIYTIIDLPYHPMIKKFISKWIDNEKGMNIMLGRSLLYMPVFEQELMKQGMPLELKLLPVVESSLIPNAISRAGAGGLWQFMPYTAKLYGLSITSLVDDRFDPIKSTEAACRHLKDLYNIYKNWTLAIAAYNCGAGNVNRALAKAKKSATYWDIYPYLPSQTRDYVPLFIAANYAFTFYKTHNLDIRDVPEIIITDTVIIKNRVMDLRQISSTLGISDLTIKMLNPQFKTWVVPANGRDYVVNIPSRKILAFEQKKDTIFAKDSLYLPKKMTASDIAELETKPSVYVVKRGDVLGSISRKYRVSVKRIIQLNNLKSANTLKIGQKLRLS